MSQRLAAMVGERGRVAAFAMDAQCASHGQLIVDVLNQLRRVGRAQILICNTEEDGLPERKSTKLYELAEKLLTGMVTDDETIVCEELKLLTSGYYRLDVDLARSKGSHTVTTQRRGPKKI